MEYRYLLSSGEATTKAEEYIIDLFRIYLVVYPGDIPHYPSLGFDFIVSNITKDNLKTQIKSRIDQLIQRIQDKMGGMYKITLPTFEVLDEETVRIVIDVNGTQSEEMLINFYSES